MLDEQEAAASCTPHSRRAPRIGFAEMARTISQRWKQIDPQEKEELEFCAALGRQRYYEEVEEWRQYTKEMEEGVGNYEYPSNANNIAHNGFSQHVDVMHNHYNETVIVQDDFHHQNQHQATQIVHGNNGVLFDQANNNQFVSFPNNDQCQDAAEDPKVILLPTSFYDQNAIPPHQEAYDFVSLDNSEGHAAEVPDTILPENFYEQLVMAQHQDARQAYTFNNDSNAVLVVTKDAKRVLQTSWKTNYIVL
jgi:hypothetical protein